MIRVTLCALAAFAAFAGATSLLGLEALGQSRDGFSPRSEGRGYAGGAKTGDGLNLWNPAVLAFEDKVSLSLALEYSLVSAKSNGTSFTTSNFDIPSMTLSFPMGAFGAAGVRTKSPPLEALKKDSLEITDDERLLVANVVAAAPTDRVLVTHGTDTMSETATLIESLGCDKTVVLTGSMVPRDFPGSDADFNLGFAYAAAQMLPPGVYVAMHGKALPHSQYKKDRSIGRFEEI